MLNINPKIQQVLDKAPDSNLGQKKKVRVSLYTKYGKRLFDLILVILLLPIFIPLIAILALLIMSDGNSPFFGHVRIGRGGRKFKCWKLRSMKVGAEQSLYDLIISDPIKSKEWEIYQKFDVDPRVTYFGKFLRKLRLDELPQIFNVFTGELSFVGPRPFTPDQADKYEKFGGRAYYKIRPGITGRWQVTPSKKTKFKDRIHHDEEYAKNITFFADLLILAKTLPVFLKANGK